MDDEVSLYEAILSLKTASECRAFFHDLCTPAEILAMGQRWQIARLLEKGGLSYREIQVITGASLTTIGRVARFLSYESHQGYRALLKRKGESHEEQK